MTKIVPMRRTRDGLVPARNGIPPKRECAKCLGAVYDGGYCFNHRRLVSDHLRTRPARKDCGNY